MECTKDVSYALILGVKDSISGTVGIFTLHKASYLNTASKNEDLTPKKSKLSDPNGESSHNIAQRILQCCFMNGGLCLLSKLLIDFLVIPLLQSVIFLLLGYSGHHVWEWLHPILSATFRIFWVIPIFLLSRILNFLWFQDIADAAYKYRRGRPNLLPSLSKFIADSLFSVLIQTLFLVQVALLSLLPITFVSHLITLVQMCLLYSLYAFEYKWLNMGWELHKRLAFIELNWPYFLGFGLPLALITSWPNSYIVSGSLFAVVFPLFIISANDSKPRLLESPFALPLFSAVVAVSNLFFSKFVSKPQQPHTKKDYR